MFNQRGSGLNLAVDCLKPDRSLWQGFFVGIDYLHPVLNEASPDLAGQSLLPVKILSDHLLGQAEEGTHDDHQDTDHNRHQQTNSPTEVSIRLALDSEAFLPRLLETAQSLLPRLLETALPLLPRLPETTQAFLPRLLETTQSLLSRPFETTLSLLPRPLKTTQSLLSRLFETALSLLPRLPETTQAIFLGHGQPAQ